MADPADDTRPPIATAAGEWNARYREHEGTMWSGRANGRLVAEIAHLPPGQALDVGCGEGADAIWLAQRGWTVTAIDVSDVAVGRAGEAAALAGVTVDWISGDALQTHFAEGSFDLVSVQYPARAGRCSRCTTTSTPTTAST
jgi:2-polyprenyl-3-methyl-5-hydroxy-6-metoxy-1,4-benzoquinol methylase